MSVPWVLLIGIRAVRAFRDPDRWDGGGFGGGQGGVFSEQYVERQFERPRDESKLL